MTFLLQMSLFIIVATSLAFAFAGLGRYLRKKGYGPQLDVMAQNQAAVRAKWQAQSLRSIENSAKAFASIPLLGNKRIK